MALFSPAKRVATTPHDTMMMGSHVRGPRRMRTMLLGTCMSEGMHEGVGLLQRD